MNDLLQAFLLGNGAILTNTCLLPLYPGMIAFLSGNSLNPRSRSVSTRLGWLVLVGILSMMVAIGTLLVILKQSFAGVLPWILPLIYGGVVGLGILMVLDINGFARLRQVQSPVLSNPYLTAYLYGLLLGPMTLPCTGPIITTAFLLSSDSHGSVGIPQLAAELLYFLLFGLGFGWPLVLLPFLAWPVQQRWVGWLARHHRLLNRVTGCLLILIGLFGIGTELIPQWISTPTN